MKQLLCSVGMLGLILAGCAAPTEAPQGQDNQPLLPATPSFSAEPTQAEAAEAAEEAAAKGAEDAADIEAAPTPTLIWRVEESTAAGGQLALVLNNPLEQDIRGVRAALAVPAGIAVQAVQQPDDSPFSFAAPSAATASDEVRVALAIPSQMPSFSGTELVVARVNFSQTAGQGLFFSPLGRAEVVDAAGQSFAVAMQPLFISPT